MKFYTPCQKGAEIVFVLLLFLITGFTCQALAGEDTNQAVRIIPEDEMPIIMELIAGDIRQNYEKIKMWSGNINKKITWVHTGNLAEKLFKNAEDTNGRVPEAILQKAEDKITFAVDAVKNFVYVDTLRDKPSKYFNYDTAENIGNSGPRPIWSTVVAKPDFLLKAEDLIFEKGTGRLIHKKAIKKPSKREPQTGWYKLGDIWDPRRAFFPGADFTWDVLDSSIKRINNFGRIEFDGYRFKIEEYKKGDSIEYKIISPAVVNDERSKPEHYVILTTIFSSKCGFNMTYWEAATGNGKVLQKFTYEYEDVNGIYLPKKVLEQIYKNETVTAEYDSTYNNNKVNQEISPGTFEQANLNLKDGDVLVDEIEKKEYRYEAATKTFNLSEKQKK